MFTDVGLDRRVAALEAVLIAQAFKSLFGGMPLLAVPAEVFQQPLVDKAGKAIQLRPLDLRCAPIPWRDRKARDLLHARPRNPKVNSCRTRAHPAPKRETDLPVKFHAENTPALPVTRKGQSGKVLLCPQQDYPATSVANFRTAVLNFGWYNILRHAARRPRHCQARCSGSGTGLGPPQIQVLDDCAVVFYGHPLFVSCRARLLPLICALSRIAC